MAINNELMAFASIKERKELLLDVENLAPCIYRVPKILRKINEEAYTPQVISIGPLHQGNQELYAMENHKIIFIEEFHKRISVETWQKFVNFMEENEQRIRDCYAEMPKFENSVLLPMILCDAIFIIEYLLRRYRKVQSDILMNSLRPVKYSIWTDLLLLENQLPYFVLKGLYMLAFSQYGDEYPSFFLLSFLFVCPDMSDKVPNYEVEVKHFIDLRRYFVTKMHYGNERLKSADRDLPSVVKLHESGVTFKSYKESECFIDMRVEKKKLLRIPSLNMEFTELQIPQIRIYDNTETLIRNLMALEQCHYPDETHVCNYINLIDSIIDTEEDVNLLVEAGIISNRVGETAKIAKMFNQLGSSIIFSRSPYHDVVMKLKAHYENPLNHAKATLKRVYFSNPWKGTGTVAAVVLLLLTLIQTICSIKSA